jgi:hypothetical protein
MLPPASPTASLADEIAQRVRFLLTGGSQPPVLQAQQITHLQQ